MWKAPTGYIAKFVSLIRQTLDNSSRELIPLATEIRYLETYLSLEQNRQEENLLIPVTTVTDGGCWYISCPQCFYSLMLKMPYGTAFVSRPDNKGIVEIQFETDAAGHLVCTIKDNGRKGQAAELKSKSNTLNICPVKFYYWEKNRNAQTPV